MFNSVRIRLTVWYSGVLALVLVMFAFATYFFLAVQIRQLTDENLRELASGFINTAEREYADAQDEDEEASRIKSEKINDALDEAADELRLRDYRIFVFDSNGKPTVASKDFLSEHQLAAGDLPRNSEGFFEFTDAEKHSFRTFTERFSVGGESYDLLVAYSLEEQTKLLQKVKTIFTLAVPLSLLLAGFGGYFLARKSLAPITEMSAKARKITAENLHERLPVENERDELGKMAGSFNELLARLDESFASQRRFMADASHELRTPIAIVRGESEVALSKEERTPEDYRESLDIIQDEGRRMTRIVEDLLTLARADAGQLPLRQTKFYLDELIEDCIRKLRSLAESREIRLEFAKASEMLFHGDEELTRRLFLNLLDNALKHTDAKGSVKISATQRDEFYEIEIADSGSGISADAQEHIFERFFRADAARSRASAKNFGSGAGLGLSIALWICEAHDGTLQLQKSDANGTTFLVKLPVE